MYEKSCSSQEIGSKSFFLGPQSENSKWFKEIITETFEHWFRWRKSLYPEDGKAISSDDQSHISFQANQAIFKEKTKELMTRFESEVPKFSPRYMAHMFSETSLPAFFGQVIGLLHNPNIISGEVGRVGVQIEDEAIQALCEMVGFDPAHAQGHFTSGGTIANFESMIRARARQRLWLETGARAAKFKIEGAPLSLFEAAHLGWNRFRTLNEACLNKQNINDKSFSFTHGNPFQVAENISSLFQTRYLGPVALIPNHKHYSWEKGISLLGLSSDSFWPIELDQKGRIQISSLKAQIERAAKEQRPILMAVSVAGTTEIGTVDPIDQIQDVLRDKNIWHHVDGAYGGYLCTMLRPPKVGNLKNISSDTQEILSIHCINALSAISQADSVTIDPHKLGYVPYSSGAFLCRELIDYQCPAFDGPYLDIHTRDRGPYTLEGSRGVSGAAATWMTAQTMGLNSHGYGRTLGRTLIIKQKLEKELRKRSQTIQVLQELDTNLIAFTVASRGDRISFANEKTEKLYQHFSPEHSKSFTVSKTKFSQEHYSKLLNHFYETFEAEADTDSCSFIRLVIMNPFLESKEMNISVIDAFLEEIDRFISR